MGPAHTGPDFGQDLGPDFRGPVFAPLAGDDPATVSGHRIGARLGADGPGAAGTTYLAYEPGGQPVALTVIRPELTAADGFASRFHHDAQAAARVPGPRAVPVLGSGREGERYWIACGYVPSLSLRAAVEGAGPLPTGVVLRLVAALAEGLQAMHHAGVVHGGLRPAHVLLAGDGPRVKGHGLAWVAQEAGNADAGSVDVAGVDSGSADAASGAAGSGAAGSAADGTGEAGAGGPEGAGGAGESGDAGRASAHGAAREAGPAEVGEATAFRSPEQAAGKPARAATDVFALGQIAAYASIGSAPFGDGSRVQHAEPDLNELPGQLREIVTRCLIKDPALRPSLAQITTMCAQAAPESRPVSWLPAPLLAAILPAIPPPHFAQPPAAAAPPAAHPAAPVSPPHPPQPPHRPAPEAPPAPAPAPAPGAEEPWPGPAPAGRPPEHAHAQVPGPPGPLGPPGPPGPPQHGGYLWHPQQWPRAPYVHVPLPLPRKKRKAVGVVAAVAGFAVVATAAVALSSGDGGGKPTVGAQPPAAGAPQPSPSPSSPSAPAMPSPTMPSPTSPPPGGGATGSPPETGLVYQQLHLPAGDGMSLRGDPPTVSSGTYSGDFGFTGDAAAFTADRSRDTLALIPAASPATAAACRSSDAVRVNSVNADSLGEGARLCVRSVDGTVTALVTFRQLPARQAAHPVAVLDLTVWHEVAERSAPGTGIRANFADGVARRG
ncbi:hypothetical protein OG896_07575 [Streptomyces sp. NBC_00669]|uniref:hypothetical protein n=1 Tax=Streptomyces sp. NBC_00669 TaxID=2976011 RepID=UPI002E2FC83D|nr:hypothetical protein [Streptomyces sp. NBC_00669]